MNYLKQRVIDSLKWKKHPSYCAKKLNISEERYIKIKKEVQEENREQKRKSRFLNRVKNYRNR